MFRIIFGVCWRCCFGRRSSPQGGEDDGEMAVAHEICYVTEDGQTIQSVVIPSSCTVQTFFDYLLDLTKVNTATRLRLLDYKGDLIYPSPIKLPTNTPDTAYYFQILPETALAEPNLALSEDLTMDLVQVSEGINKMVIQCEDCVADTDDLLNLKHAFEKLRNKLENGSFTKRINASMEVTPAHRKLKYRRLSDSKQKEVREKFFSICNDTLSEEVLQCLRLPSFDCNEWSDEEILLILQHMYIQFELPTKFNINMTTLRNFLFQVYKNYNDVPFHNFRHSFCVTQMMYAMILKVDLVKLIGDLEILVLITSCICHDLDHPGYNNIYQINARTELALRYNDISPLENHHCSMAFRILELPECNIFENMDADTFRIVREGIIRCILATDMARHNEILAQFRDAVEEGFNFSNRIHVNLLCMILIKVADISNEARPMDVAEPWLDKLFREFFAQSDAEKKEGLPVTPFMDRDKITKPSSQCSFIGFVLLPLFETLGNLFPELDELIVRPVRYALDYYRKLNEAVKDEQRQQRKSVVTLDAGNSTITSPSSPAGAASIQAQLMHKLAAQKSEDASIFSEVGLDSLDDLTDDEEEEETKTEVAVSEKTLKFKISTESTAIRSHPGSRKGSREKTQDFDMVRAYRQERSNRTSESGADKKSWSSSENTSSYEDRKSDNSHKRYQSFSPTTAIPESSSNLQNAVLKDKLKKLTKQQQQEQQEQEILDQSKAQSSSTRSPDLKRFMNRMVRDFRGSKNKVANGMKTTDDASCKSNDSRTSSNSNRQQHKEPKSPSWMATLFQNIKLRSTSHENDPQ